MTRGPDQVTRGPDTGGGLLTQPHNGNRVYKAYSSSHPLKPGAAPIPAHRGEGAHGGNQV